MNQNVDNPNPYKKNIFRMIRNQCSSYEIINFGSDPPSNPHSFTQNMEFSFKNVFKSEQTHHNPTNNTGT